MLVSVEELERTSLYPEIINKITRCNENEAELHIMDAESLVRSYMSMYDVDAIFGTTESAPTFKGSDVQLIKKMIKMIASYFLVRKANPNVNIELFRADYEDALEWLDRLQQGKVNPSLPYNPVGNTSDVAWKSLPKQENFF